MEYKDEYRKIYSDIVNMEKNLNQLRKEKKEIEKKIYEKMKQINVNILEFDDITLTLPTNLLVKKTPEKKASIPTIKHKKMILKI